MSRKCSIWAVGIVVSTNLVLLVTAAEAHYVNGSQNVNGNRSTAQYTDDGTTYGPYGWNYSYTRKFDGTSITKDIEIDFVFDEDLGYTDEEQKIAYRQQVEQQIEGMWNNKFVVKDGTNTFPCVVDITTTGPFNQTVRVSAGDGRADMTHWYVQNTASIVAHEVGHTMGLFDEYIGGAVDQYPNPTLSNDGIMGNGALLANPTFYPRYFQQYADYMTQLNGHPPHSFTVVAVPEPAGIVALLLVPFWAQSRRGRSPRIMNRLLAVQLVAAAAIYGCSRHAASVPAAGAESMQSVSLRDVHPLFGGANLYLNADGSGICQIVQPSPHAGGLIEKRFSITADAATVKELNDAISDHRFFDLTEDLQPAVPDASRISITVTLASGRSATVTNWSSVRNPDFDVIYKILLKVIKSAQLSPPLQENVYDPHWRP